MPWYAINTAHMIASLRASIPQVKQVWLADDSAGGGSIVSLYQWYKNLCEEGIKFGYIVNGAKSWLIVKTSELAESAKKVFGDEVNITLEGRRHLGAVIGSKEFKDQYCQEKVDKWLREMESLVEISKSQPHAAYIAFTKGFKSKFTYCGEIACGEMFTVNHALSCKKGGFVAQRHDTIRDLLTSHISKVREARLHMKAGGFWTPGVTAFFDVRVTHVNSRSNQGKYTATIFKEQENEKKRKYNQRVMDVEMGTFTPLVFGTNGGMGLDCQNFLRTLANKLSTKNDELHASVISWLRIQLSFSILRSVHKRVRGSRYPFKSREVLEDFTLALAGLQLYS